MIKKILMFLIVPFLFAFSQTPSNEADQILGVWLTGNKDAKVEIFKRGEKYFGKIVWLKNPTYEDGNPKVDKENPEDSLKTRPIMGLELLKDFEYDEDYVWEDGEIYDPKSGKTYSCKMTLQEDMKTLEVRGYIGFSLLGRTQEWLRTNLD